MLRTAGTASRSGRKVQVFQVRKHLETGWVDAGER